MGHTVITFLGIYPKKTDYYYQGKIYTGQVFAEALLQFLEFDRMVVLTTEEAESVFLQTLSERNDPRIQKISIPEGKNEAEIWNIFEKVIQAIPENETVTFDITHGLRSIPFLVFLFAAYLKSAKGVSIRSIFYGAQELSRKNNNIAPVLDLSSFADMLDWINAADQFIQTGNAIGLANLLEKREKKAADALRKVSQAALLAQPFSLSNEAQKLQKELTRAANSFPHTSQPFTLLTDNIVRTFTPFILPEGISKESPVPSESGKELLSREWNLIEWYYHHGHWMQALTLAREFIIDLIVWETGDTIDLKPENRSTVEKGITGVFRIGKKFRDDNGEVRLFTENDLNVFGAKFYTSHPQAMEIATLFDSVSFLRNQLDHAEHKKDTLRFSKLLQKIPQDLEKVRRLYEEKLIIPFETGNTP
ncbi:TIGR02221 family CRISPR-associated protein [Anaerolinea sp.]|uniref:TIGR02221 family CRISPR-associated protein n=1 Tax=Anaerolinea sp. TaxID=1872519 RepID=UPI002ACE3D59|nr:TIGR02221 family CRISPR-associated protein [Anaerolinea sp.]